MIANLIRRLLTRFPETLRLEREVNDPTPGGVGPRGRTGGGRSARAAAVRESDPLTGLEPVLEQSARP